MKGTTMINETTIYTAYELCDLDNPWHHTPYEIYYTIGAKSKGSVGEAIVAQFLREKGQKVNKRVNPGHDLIVDGIKTEIKFSLASKRNCNKCFTFNHIGVNKDWERIIFCGINGDLEECFVWFDKNTLKQILHDEKCFTLQEGEDDFFSMGSRSSNLLNHPLAKKMEEW